MTRLVLVVSSTSLATTDQKTLAHQNARSPRSSSLHRGCPPPVDCSTHVRTRTCIHDKKVNAAAALTETLQSSAGAVAMLTWPMPVVTSAAWYVGSSNKEPSSSSPSPTTRLASESLLSSLSSLSSWSDRCPSVDAECRSITGLMFGRPLRERGGGDCDDAAAPSPPVAAAAVVVSPDGDRCTTILACDTSGDGMAADADAGAGAGTGVARAGGVPAVATTADDGAVPSCAEGMLCELPDIIST